MKQRTSVLLKGISTSAHLRDKKGSSQSVTV